MSYPHYFIKGVGYVDEEKYNAAIRTELSEGRTVENSTWRNGHRDQHADVFNKQPYVVAGNGVNPCHYIQGSVETIDAIDSVVVGYKGVEAVCVGNIVKYLARAPFKGNRAEDLQKALWYLKRLIDGGGDDC